MRSIKSNSFKKKVVFKKKKINRRYNHGYKHAKYVPGVDNEGWGDLLKNAMLQEGNDTFRINDTFSINYDAARMAMTI
jgi:hypothetical protein